MEHHLQPLWSWKNILGWFVQKDNLLSLFISISTEIAVSKNSICCSYHVNTRFEILMNPIFM